MKRIICCVLLAAMILSILTGCSGNDYASMFDGISIHGKKVKLGPVKIGDSLEDVLKAEGITENDVLYTEKSKGNASAGMYEDLIFEEFEPYGVKKAFHFKDGKLTGVDYVSRLFNVPYDEAYELCMDAFNKADKMLKKAESMENGSIDSLKQTGGLYMKQYFLQDMEITVSITYQDTSESDVSDTDLLNFALTIGKRNK